MITCGLDGHTGKLLGDHPVWVVRKPSLIVVEMGGTDQLNADVSFLGSLPWPYILLY